MKKTSRKIYTIGYEGRSINEVISLLKSAHVDKLFDARASTRSRKAGFSKTSLKTALEKADIGYEHRKELGTPPNLMKELRTNGHYALTEYAKYIDSHPLAVIQAAKDLGGLNVAIMCFERDAQLCHRSIVTDRLARIIDAKIEHL